MSILVHHVTYRTGLLVRRQQWGQQQLAKRQSRWVVPCQRVQEAHNQRNPEPFNKLHKQWVQIIKQPPCTNRNQNVVLPPVGAAHRKDDKHHKRHRRDDQLHKRIRQIRNARTAYRRMLRDGMKQGRYLRIDGGQRGGLGHIGQAHLVQAV